MFIIGGKINRDFKSPDEEKIAAEDVRELVSQRERARRVAGGRDEHVVAEPPVPVVVGQQHQRRGPAFRALRRAARRSERREARRARRVVGPPRGLDESQRRRRVAPQPKGRAARVAARLRAAPSLRREPRHARARARHEERLHREQRPVRFERRRRPFEHLVHQPRDVREEPLFLRPRVPLGDQDKEHAHLALGHGPQLHIFSKQTRAAAFRCSCLSSFDVRDLDPATPTAGSVSLPTRLGRLRRPLHTYWL